jgi:hypothetical protein
MKKKKLYAPDVLGIFLSHQRLARGEGGEGSQKSVYSTMFWMSAKGSNTTPHPEEISRKWKMKGDRHHKRDRLTHMIIQYSGKYKPGN